MSLEVFISGRPDLRLHLRVEALADDLFKFLAPAGEVFNVRSFGTGWSIDLRLHDDASLDEWAGRLLWLLRTWGVPAGTCFTILPNRSAPVTGFRRVEVL